MRGLYWLTALTLVAAAVTTVAIADYSRRHAGPAFGSFHAGPVTKPVTTLMAPVENTTPQFILADTEPKKLACEGAACSPGVPTAGIPVHEVPEHEKLKAQALNDLAIMQDPPVPVPARPVTPPVADDFTFPGTVAPATPTPVQPSVPAATLRPLHAMTPLAPPEFKPSAAEGPEIIPGLRASAPEPKPEDDQPIRDCLAAGAEVFTYLTPQPYLWALPEMPKQDGKVRAAGCQSACPPVALPRDFDGPWHVVTPPTSSFATDGCTFATQGKVQDKQSITSTCVQAPSSCCVPAPAACCAPAPAACCAPAPAACCAPAPAACCAPAPAACCAPAAKAEDIVVRTYSVAEFSTEGNPSYQELIQLITNMIAPETWETKDSNIIYFAQGKCLVVRHKASVQKEVDELLSHLRTAVQKQTRTTALLPPPIIRMEPTRRLPYALEVVPLPPIEAPLCRPRVITNEPCPLGDDEFFGMVPLRANGRLFPVPTRLDLNPLVPAGYNFLDEGPAGRVTDKRVPDFFPLMLPYAPLPSSVEGDVQKSSLEVPVKPASVMPKK